MIAKVLSKLQDHSLVLATTALGVPKEYEEERERWLYKKADWKGLCRALANTNWSFVEEASSTDLAQEELTAKILATARKYIPVSTEPIKKSTHPWMNERCLKLVAAKRAAEGTEAYKQRLEECSKGVLEEYQKYVETLRQELKKLPRSSKKWWKLAKCATTGEAVKGSVPPLKNDKGEWVTTATGKSNLFKETLTQKYHLAEGEENEYSNLAADLAEGLSRFLPVRRRKVVQQLKLLNEDKATRPDNLSARILRQCAEELELSISKFIRRVLNTGVWPKA